MTWSSISSISPAALVAAAFSLPLFSLVLAALVFAGTLLVRRVANRGDGPVLSTGHSMSSAAGRYLSERRALGVGAIGVISVFAIENVVRGYLVNLADVVSWWQYATPVLAAFTCLAILLGFIVVGGKASPERSVAPTARRTWTSFGPRWGLVGAFVALAVLLVTTVAAGMASSADDRGRYIFLEIPVPNVPVDALRPWFYGWAYGVPVLICLAALIAVTWATLRSNALRPFLGRETAGAERRERAVVASGAVNIATAGMLLALGGAFRFIGRSGSISHLTIGGDGKSETYQTVWRYADLAVAATWLAPVLEIAAFILLLVVARGLLRSRVVVPSDEHTVLTPTETVR